MDLQFELRDVRVFLTLADELHFGRTGELLGLTPSRVSQIVRGFERRVGGRVFERTSRRVALTPLGEQLRRAMLPAYQRMERAFNDARATATGIAGTVRLGMYSPANGGPHLPEIITRFKAMYPSCDVAMVDTGLERDQFEWLRHDRADLLAMRLPISDPDIDVGPTLSSEPRVVAVADGHPLAAREAVTLDDLVEYTLTDVPSLPTEVMRAFLPPMTPSGRRLQRVTLHTITEAFMRVAAGEIVHPTVPSTAEFYSMRGITLVPLHGLPPSETALVWLAARTSRTVENFVDVATEVLNEHRPDDGGRASPS